MNTFRYNFFVITVLFFSSLVAMDLPIKEEPPIETPLVLKPQQQGKTRFFSSLDNIPYKMRDAYSNPDLNNYRTDAFVMTQKGVIDAMNKAVEERKATVDLSVGVHHQNRRDAYKPTSVECAKDQHGKNMVGLECSPSKKNPKKALFLTGSANATDAVWPTGNFESVVQVEGDIDLSKKAYELMRSNEVIADKKIIMETPKKRKVYSSRRTALNKSRAQRILSVAQSTDDDRIVWVSSMNFNDTDMADALSLAAKSGADTRLVVNKSALTKYGIPLLKQMFADGVQIYVFYPAEGSRLIQHKKELIRNDLYVISNANFTDEGDRQRNLETYFPGDTQLIADAKIDFERVQNKCVSWEKALELYEEQSAKIAKQKQKNKELKKRKASALVENAGEKRRTKKIKVRQ